MLNVEAMSVKGLRQYAKENKIKLPRTATNRASILEVIKAAAPAAKPAKTKPVSELSGNEGARPPYMGKAKLPPHNSETVKTGANAIEKSLSKKQPAKHISNLPSDVTIGEYWLTLFRHNEKEFAEKGGLKTGWVAVDVDSSGYNHGVLEDSEITDHLQSATNKTSDVFKQVSLVRGRMNRQANPGVKSFEAVQCFHRYVRFGDRVYRTTARGTPLDAKGQPIDTSKDEFFADLRVQNGARA